MLSSIKTEEDILSLSKQYGWKSSTTSQLLRILKHASQHNLKLFRELGVAMVHDFVLCADSSPGLNSQAAYFKTADLSLLDALFTALDDAEKQRVGADLSTLNQRIESLENALLGANLGQDPSAKMQSTDALLVHDDSTARAPDKDDLFAYNLSSPEFDICLHRMVASTGGTVEFGIKTDSFSCYFARYHRLPALKIETMVAKALPKRVARTYAFYFELPRDLELLQWVLRSDAKLYLELLHSNNS